MKNQLKDKRNDYFVASQKCVTYQKSQCDTSALQVKHMQATCPWTSSPPKNNKNYILKKCFINKYHLSTDQIKNESNYANQSEESNSSEILFIENSIVMMRSRVWAIPTRTASFTMEVKLLPESRRARDTLIFFWASVPHSLLSISPKKRKRWINNLFFFFFLWAEELICNEYIRWQWHHEYSKSWMRSFFLLSFFLYVCYFSQ